MANSFAAAEVLACPHCDRLFHITSAVLGKKIRCRECRQIFHVPLDVSSVPLGPAVGVGDAVDAPLPPVAIASVQDGLEVRSCPACGRTFAMKPAFIGKTIRCRGCKDPFRVLATEAVAAERALPSDPPIEARGSGSPSESLAPPPPPQPPAVPPTPPVPTASPPPPAIFDDIGDVLEDLLPGESVISVVRPRYVHRRSQSVDMAPVCTIVAALCGVCLMLGLHLIQRDKPRPPPTDGLANVPVVSTPDGNGGQRLKVQSSPLDDIDTTKTLRKSKESSPLSHEATAALEGLLRDLFGALRREDFAAAERGLTDAAKVAGGNREARQRIQRWRLFTDYAKGFVGHRTQAFENAKQGREYEVDGDVIVVSEVTPDHITYRRRGEKKRVPRSTLDPRVEMAIVGTWLEKGGYAANHIYLGVRWLCLDPADRERARREWQTANARGARAEALLPILDEPFIR